MYWYLISSVCTFFQDGKNDRHAFCFNVCLLFLSKTYQCFVFIIILYSMFSTCLTRPGDTEMKPDHQPISSQPAARRRSAWTLIVVHNVCHAPHDVSSYGRLIHKCIRDYLFLEEKATFFCSVSLCVVAPAWGCVHRSPLGPCVVSYHRSSRESERPCSHV